MKKFYITVLVTFLLSASTDLFAQDLDVSWGPQLKAKGRVNNIIGYDDNGYYVLRSPSSIVIFGVASGGKLYLERYNKNHEMEFSREIKLKNDKKKKLNLEGVYYVGGKLLLFTSFYDKKEDKNFAYAQHLAETGEPEDEPVQVDEIFSEKKGNAGSFDVAVSKDNSKILVYHNEPYKKNENERFNYRMFDGNLQLLWERQIELPYKDKNVSITDYKIDALGSVYALISVTNEKKDKSKGADGKKKANYTYYILEYANATDKLENYKVNLAGKFVSDITFADDPAHNAIVCSGFYSNKNNGDLAGVFYMRIDKASQEVTEKGMKEFGKDFLSLFMGEKKAKKGKELYQYDLRHFILRDDGGAILVAEQYYVREVCRQSKSGYYCNYYYYYNDIICASINPDASIAWVGKVPKYQVTVNDGGYYSSYILALSNNRLYFVYNDNPKNMKVAGKPIKGKVKLKPMNRPKKAIAMMCSFDMTDGKAEWRPLLNAKTDKGTILRPKIHQQLNEKEILIYGERGQYYKFGTVTVN